MRSKPSVIPAAARCSGVMRPCVRRDAAVRGRGGVRQRGFGVAEVGRDRQKPAAIDDFPGFCTGALDFEGDDGPPAFLLALREFELRVRRQAGIVDARYPRMIFQPPRELQGL